MSRDDKQRRDDECGLRPMVPRKDLRSVVQLISEGFDEWQSRRGRIFLSLLKVLSYAGPFISLARLSPAFRQFCSAIVWVEKGQVVGVVAGHPIGPDPRYWVFKNIVVSRSHRGRGIGRELQRGLIEKALSEGAEKAMVMVRVNNPTSLNLASSDGFHPLTVTAEMTLTAPQKTAPAIESEDSLRPHRPSDQHQVYELTQTVIPSALRSFSPVTEDGLGKRFDETLGSGLSNLLSGQRVHRFVLDKDGEVAATLMVETCLWGEHRLEMAVHPRWRGHLEEMLIGRALAVLAQYPRRPVSIKVPTDYPEAIEVLSRYGFIRKKTQVILGLDLREFRDQGIQG